MVNISETACFYEIIRYVTYIHMSTKVRIIGKFFLLLIVRKILHALNSKKQSLNFKFVQPYTNLNFTQDKESTFIFNNIESYYEEKVKLRKPEQPRQRGNQPQWETASGLTRAGDMVIRRIAG